jgi:hypothetical protein
MYVLFVTIYSYLNISCFKLKANMYSNIIIFFIFEHTVMCMCKVSFDALKSLVNLFITVKLANLIIHN